MRQEDAHGTEEVNPGVCLHKPQRCSEGQRLRHLRHHHGHLRNGEVLILPQDIRHEYAEKRGCERYGEGDDDAVENRLPGLLPAEKRFVPPQREAAPHIRQFAVVKRQEYDKAYGDVKRHDEGPGI